MTDKKFNVVGIGNAIVDVLAHIDDHFLTRHNLTKGMMKLVDEAEADRLHKAIDVKDEVAGGSAANTIAGMASLGDPVAYIGKVQDDQLGTSFENGLRNSGIYCNAKKAEGNISTARCVILVTPDAQRTMNTYLGIAGLLGPQDIDETAVADSKVTYLEGYLWDREDAKNAFLKAINIAHSSGGKVSLSLSDSFCVDRHRAEFLDLVKNHVDILFANEDEIKSLFETGSFEIAIDHLKNLGVTGALTRSENGSVIVSPDETHAIEIEPVAKVVDTTGAGDLYAAGFLHGYVTGRDLHSCGHMGSIAAAEIVSHFGARPEKSLGKLICEKGL